MLARVAVVPVNDEFAVNVADVLAAVLTLPVMVAPVYVPDRTVWARTRGAIAKTAIKARLVGNWRMRSGFTRWFVIANCR